MSLPTEFELHHVHTLLESFKKTEIASSDANRLSEILEALPVFLGRVANDGYIDIEVGGRTYSGQTEYDYENVPPTRRPLTNDDSVDTLFKNMLQTPEGAGASNQANVDLNRYYVDRHSGFKLKIVDLGNNKYTVRFSSNPVEKIQNLLGAMTIFYNKTDGRAALIESAVKAVKEDIEEATNHFTDNADFSDDFESPEETKHDMLDYANSLFDENGDFENNLRTPEALEAFSSETSDFVDSANIRIVEELEKVPESDAQIILNTTGSFISKMMSYLPDVGITDEVIKAVRQIDAMRRAIVQLDQSLRAIFMQAQVATNPPTSDNDKIEFIKKEIIPSLLDRDALVNGYQKSVRHLWNIVDMTTGLVPFMPDVMWRENNIFKIPDDGLSDDELLVAAPVIEMSEDKYLNPTLLGKALTTNVSSINYVNIYDQIGVSTEDNLKLLFADILSLGSGETTGEQTALISDIVSSFITKRKARFELEDAFTPSQIEQSEVLTRFASLAGLGQFGLGNVAEYDALASSIADAVTSRSAAKWTAKGAAKSAGQGLLKVTGKVVSVLTTASFVNLIVLLYTFSKAISILIDSICRKQNSIITSILCPYVLMPVKTIAEAVSSAIEDSAETAIRATGRLISEATPDSWKLALKIGVFGAVGIGLYALYKRTVPATQVAPVVPRLMPVSPTPRAVDAQEFEYEDDAPTDDSWVPVSSNTEILMPSDSAPRPNAVRRRYR